MLLTILDNVRVAVILIALFGASIFVHELGHYLVARWCGLVVEVFSIGFGPSIWKTKRNGILYKVGIIPIGGYVALPQLDPSGMNRIQGTEGTADSEAGPEALPSVSAGKKILVSLAGAVGNVLFAFVLAMLIWKTPTAITFEGSTVIGEVEATSEAYASGVRQGDQVTAVNGTDVASWYEVSTECLLASESGEVTLSIRKGGETRDVTLPLEVNARLGLPMLAGVYARPIPCVLARISPGSRAEEAGLKAGDVVVTFEGLPVRDNAEFQQLVTVRGGQDVPITVRRGSELVNLVVRPKANPETGNALIGVQLSTLVMPWMRYKQPWAQVKSDAVGVFRVLKALATPKESGSAAKGLGGPVAIIVMLWTSVKISILSGIGFIRFLNVNLALLNLLPIPVLDGGHIVFATIEGLRRKPLNPRFAGAMVNAFAILLISLLLILTVRDLDRFTRVGPFVRGLFDGRDMPAAELQGEPQAAPAAPTE